MNNFIDFESCNFQGEERLAAAAIGGLYAMIVTGGISDCESLKEDFMMRHWMNLRNLLQNGKSWMIRRS